MFCTWLCWGLDGVVVLIKFLGKTFLCSQCNSPHPRISVGTSQLDKTLPRISWVGWVNYSPPIPPHLGCSKGQTPGYASKPRRATCKCNAKKRSTLWLKKLIICFILISFLHDIVNIVRRKWQADQSWEILKQGWNHLYIPLDHVLINKSWNDCKWDRLATLFKNVFNILIL